MIRTGADGPRRARFSRAGPPLGRRTLECRSVAHPSSWSSPSSSGYWRAGERIRNGVRRWAVDRSRQPTSRRHGDLRLAGGSARDPGDSPIRLLTRIRSGCGEPGRGARQRDPRSGARLRRTISHRADPAKSEVAGSSPAEGVTLTPRRARVCRGAVQSRARNRGSRSHPSASGRARRDNGTDHSFKRHHARAIPGGGAERLRREW